MKASMKLLAVTAALACTGVAAQEATRAPADANKDGFVSRDEFLKHMEKTWDDRHSHMMQADPAMKKDMMDHRQYDTFSRGMMGPMSGRPAVSPNPDPGKIGGTIPQETKKQ